MEANVPNKGNDDGKRLWECCDLGVCTLSIPPICRCLDKVDRCSDACKECDYARKQRTRATSASTRTMVTPGPGATSTETGAAVRYIYVNTCMLAPLLAVTRHHISSEVVCSLTCMHACVTAKKCMRFNFAARQPPCTQDSPPMLEKRRRR